MTYRLSRRARQDLLDIWSYIAEDSEAAADRFVDLVIQHLRLLATNPYIGRRRDELRPGYRSFSVGQYLIFFRIAANSIEIMHILHGRRDIGNSLDS
jgi:toxin ParE1/3/4